MAVSQIELCNLALSRSGGQRIAQITSLGEASNEARQCAVKLPHLVRIALRSHPWRFAAKKIILARVVNESNRLNSKYGAVLADFSLADFSHEKNSSLTQSEYSQKESLSLYGSSILYQYPEDCLHAGLVYSARSGAANFLQMENNEQNFTVELGQDGTKLIVTNILDAVLIYTSYASDPTVWDSLFSDALAWQLASELCVSLGNDLQKAQSLENRALFAWDKAKSADSKENGSSVFISSYIKSRN